MSKILILGGGPYHPFKLQADWFRTQLEPRGHAVTYSEDRHTLDQLADYDLLLLTSLDWDGNPTQELRFWEHPTSRPAAYTPLSDAHLHALQAHVSAGKPLFVHHCAIANWGERPELEQLFDGRWIWGQSTHGAVGAQVNVTLAAPAHALCAGLTDFSLTDELYYKLNAPRSSVVLMAAEKDGALWPLAWAREAASGRGRVLYSGLGHDMLAFASPSLQRFLVNSLDWLLAR